MDGVPTQWQLVFRVRRSIRYNSRRQGFFETVDRVLTLLLILLGSSAIGTQAKFADPWEFWLVVSIGALVAILSSVMLVFVPGVRAATHRQFVKEFTQLDKKLSSDRSKGNVRQVWLACLELEAAEPPVMRALDVLCHNELCRAEDVTDPDQYVVVPWRQRLTANFFSWAGYDFKKGGGQVS